MEKLLFFLFLMPGTATAQTSISNPDGTYSLFYYSPYGSRIIYPDGSHATLYDHDSSSATIIYADFSFSRIFYNDTTTTMINSDFSYSVIRNEAPAGSGERDTTAAGSVAPDTLKNAVDTGYILLSDPHVIKPDPLEARYILLNDLVDTTTMRSNSTLPGNPEALPEPAGKKRNGSREEIRYLHPANPEIERPGNDL